MEPNLSNVPRISFEIELETTQYEVTQRQIDELHQAMSTAIATVMAKVGIPYTESYHRIITDDLQVLDEPFDDWDDDDLEDIFTERFDNEDLNE